MKCPKCKKETYFMRENGKKISAGIPLITDLKSDIEKCPHCGFAAIFNFWFELETIDYSRENLSDIMKEKRINELLVLYNIGDM